MKNGFILFILTFGLTFGYSQTPEAPNGYKWIKNKKFSDEFNGHALLIGLMEGHQQHLEHTLFLLKMGIYK